MWYKLPKHSNVKEESVEPHLVNTDRLSKNRDKARSEGCQLCVTLESASMREKKRGSRGDEHNAMRDTHVCMSVLYTKGFIVVYNTEN